MPTDPAAPTRTKACPYCAEQIREEAIVCRFCNRDLRPQAEQPVLKMQQTTSPLAWIGAVLLLFLLAVWIWALWTKPVY